MSTKPYERHPQSAPGDFYVVNGQGLACGAPHTVAPDLIGWADLPPGVYPHCIWKKQPETEDEWDQAYSAFLAAEIKCYRYAGKDPQVIARLGEDYCDHARPPQTEARPSSSSRNKAVDFREPTFTIAGRPVEDNSTWWERVLSRFGIRG